MDNPNLELRLANIKVYTHFGANCAGKDGNQDVITLHASSSKDIGDWRSDEVRCLVFPEEIDVKDSEKPTTQCVIVDHEAIFITIHGHKSLNNNEEMKKFVGRSEAFIVDGKIGMNIEVDARYDFVERLISKLEKEKYSDVRLLLAKNEQGPWKADGGMNPVRLIFVRIYSNKTDANNEISTFWDLQIEREERPYITHEPILYQEIKGKSWFRALSEPEREKLLRLADINSVLRTLKKSEKNQSSLILLLAITNILLFVLVLTLL